MRQRYVLGFALSLIAFPSFSGFAQQTESGIQVTGTVVIERPAERMRMQVDLLAKSPKGLAEALAQLKTQRAKVEKQLEELGAIKETVKFDDPQLDNAQDDQQRMMMGMAFAQPVPQVRGARGGDDEAAKPKPPVKVKQSLRAEWTLKSADSALRLIEAVNLQDSIKDANLSGRPDPSEMSAEEAELAEELQGNGPVGAVEMPNGIAFAAPFGGNAGVSRPGEPIFAFLATISDADRDKATADAFAKAKSEASRLSKAAGIQLGGLMGLKSTGEPGPLPESPWSPQLYGNSPQSLLSADSKIPEAIGQSPGTLKYQVTVTATFSTSFVAIEPPKAVGAGRK